MKTFKLNSITNLTTTCICHTTLFTAYQGATSILQLLMKSGLTLHLHFELSPRMFSRLLVLLPLLGAKVNMKDHTGKTAVHLATNPADAGYVTRALVLAAYYSWLGWGVAVTQTAEFATFIGLHSIPTSP
jgi:hypothetical protein